MYMHSRKCSHSSCVYSDQISDCFKTNTDHRNLNVEQALSRWEVNGAPFFCRTARAVPVDRCPDKCNHGMADAHRLHDTTTVTYAVHKHNMSEYNRKRRQLVNKPSIEYVFTFVQIVQLLKLPCGERGGRHWMCQWRLCVHEQSGLLRFFTSPKFHLKEGFNFFWESNT